jgi:hypothetical protein
MSEMSMLIAESALNKQLDWVRAADSKIPPLFAIDVAMLTVIASQQSAVSACGTAAVTCALIGVALLIASIFSLAAAAVPRLGSSTPSIVYFRGIVEMGREEFLSMMYRAEPADYVEELHKQAFLNAEIATKRYTAVSWAYRFAFAAFPFWLLALVGALS